MLNPDRGEFRLQPTPVPETPKKNGHIPRWARVPAFALRTSLAILTVAPSAVVTMDTINRTDSIVDDSSRNDTVNPIYNLDQHIEVYKLYLNTSFYVSRGFRDEPNFRGDFPIDRTRNIDNAGRTHIILKAGQTLEISASGRILLQNQDYEERYVRNCNDSNLIDPDGKRYWRDTICPPQPAHRNIPRGMLLGNIGAIDYGYDPIIQIGSHWKGRVDRDGQLRLWMNKYTTAVNSGGYDITVTVYPIAAKKTEAVTIPTPKPSVTSITTTEKSSDLAGWLGGLGATLLAGLASYKFYKRWRSKRGVSAGATAGVSTGSNVGPTFRIGPVGMLGGSSNPNTAPNFGSTQPKNPEWIIGQQEFEDKWQSAKSKLLPIQPGETGNEPEHVLDRFKTAMGIVHEVSINNPLRVPLMATRVRAGIEYLIPQIWPDNRIFKKFFDPNFNAGYLNAEDLARIVYLPERDRNLSSFSNDQKKNIRRIRRILVYALHPDTAKVDADKNLQESVDDLLKRFNPAWPYIDKLIK